MQAKLQAAGLSQRLTPQAFLAIKGGALVGGLALGFVLPALFGSVAGAIFLVPIVRPDRASSAATRS